MKIFQSFAYFTLLIFTFSFSVFSQKMKVEDIISKHLDSIGTKEDREKIQNYMALGTASSNVIRSATFSYGKVLGNAVFLSEGNKIYYGVKFNSINYPTDEIIYDGDSVNTAYVKPGQHSALGYYILNNRDIVREGLFGGTLSENWTLLNLVAHGAKLEISGKKKIDGRETYILSYRSKSNMPLSIKLYFDTENFHHLRTEYRRTFPAPFTGVAEESVSQVEVVHLLTENFSDYKQENSLTLPHSYQVNLLLNGKVTDEIEWKFNFFEFRFNQKIDAVSFEVK